MRDDSCPLRGVKETETEINGFFSFSNLIWYLLNADCTAIINLFDLRIYHRQIELRVQHSAELIFLWPKINRFCERRNFFFLFGSRRSVSEKSDLFGRDEHFSKYLSNELKLILGFIAVIQSHIPLAERFRTRHTRKLPLGSWQPKRARLLVDSEFRLCLAFRFVDEMMNFSFDPFLPSNANKLLCNGSGYRIGRQIVNDVMCRMGHRIEWLPRIRRSNVTKRNRRTFSD